MTRDELLALHLALQRHCGCRFSDPAVLEEACAAHQILRDDALIQRLARIRRAVRTYVQAEFTTQS